MCEYGTSESSELEAVDASWSDLRETLFIMTLFFDRFADFFDVCNRASSDRRFDVVAVAEFAPLFCLVNFRLRCRLMTNSSWLDSLLDSSEESDDARGGVVIVAGAEEVGGLEKCIGFMELWVSSSVDAWDESSDDEELELRADGAAPLSVGGESSFDWFSSKPSSLTGDVMVDVVDVDDEDEEDELDTPDWQRTCRNRLVPGGFRDVVR